MQLNILKKLSAAIIVAAPLLASAATESEKKLIFIDTHDANRDDAVSEREFSVANNTLFTYIDRDKNGSLSQSEFLSERYSKMNAKMGEERLASIKQALFRFDVLDKDDNQKLTWKEMNASGKRIFKSYDENKDGVINKIDQVSSDGIIEQETDKELTEEQLEKRKERTLARAKRAIEMGSTHSKVGFMEKYDQNNDGQLTKKEFRKKRKANYKAKDTNNDGWLNENEYINEFMERVDIAVVKSRKTAEEAAQNEFLSLDINNDGKISADEYANHGKQYFSRLDTDQDGYVSEDDPMPSENNIAGLK